MPRLRLLVSSALLSAALVPAQCPQSQSAGLVNWDTFSGFASTWGADDEGVSSPPIALPFAFPMPGVSATLDQMWVMSNGEIYLADSTAALTAPPDAADYGADTLAEMLGDAGGLPRIVCMGDDCEGSLVAGATWSVTVDTATPGEVTVTWIDMRRYANSTDRFSFQATLFASGLVQFDYSSTVPADARFVGISIGNLEPSTSGSQDLSSLPTSAATESVLFESFTAGTWDLSGQSLLIAPDLTPGIETYTVAAVLPYVTPVCASNTNYGTGCHSFVGPDPASSFCELFAGSPAAKAALDGNGMLFSLAGNGYSVTWLPGVAPSLFVTPSGSATVVANGDDTTQSFASSVPVPIPGGFTSQWNISSNGVLTAAAVGSHGTDLSATLAEIGAATGLAWYTWRDFNPFAGGDVKVEEAGGKLYVTFDAVYEYATTNPATFQWQIDLTTGDVMMLWQSMAVSTNTTSLIVGCTLAGAGPTPVSTPLSSAAPFLMAPPVTLTPMTLSAAPRPVISPSTVVNYTAANVPEFVPGSGVRVSTLFLSVNPNPGGFDLAGILTTVPGCNAWILTLDIDVGGQVTLTPSVSWPFTYSNAFFATGNVVAAQAVALFDPTFPLANGESGGFLLSNGVLSTVGLD